MQPQENMQKPTIMKIEGYTMILLIFRDSQQMTCFSTVSSTRSGVRNGAHWEAHSYSLSELSAGNSEKVGASR